MVDSSSVGMKGGGGGGEVAYDFFLKRSMTLSKWLVVLSCHFKSCLLPLNGK